MAIVAVLTVASAAVAIDREVIVNGSSLSDPIGVGFGHWEGAEPLKISLSADPGEIETAEMFAPEAVVWIATDAAKPDPWVFETAAIMPDEAFAIQFAGTLATVKKNGGGVAPPPPEWAVAVPDVDIDAEGVPDEAEFAPPNSDPDAMVGLGLVIGQSKPVTVTLHPKRAGTLKLTSTTNGVVEIFEAAAWPAGQPLALPYEVPVDATQTLAFVARGKAEGETTLVARFVPGKKGGTGGDTDAVDKLTVKVGPLFVDLDVDSNNDGDITDVEDPIEDDATKPGKILLVNRLDFTGEGIPGYANGIDRWAHAGNGKSNGFTKMILRIPDVIDKKRATLTFTYSDATPANVLETAGQNGRHKAHDPGNRKLVRVWTRDGGMSRLVADISAAPAGHFVTAAVAHKASKVFAGVSGHEIDLWVEGIHESDEGAARISVTLDADGSGNAALQAEDHVRLTSAWLQLVFTDVTSPNGIGDTAATAVPRIPKDTEADGIACDWQEGVNDGALLVMRVVGSPILWDLLQEDKLDIEFGHILNLAFVPLPATGREGEYLAWPASPLVPDQPASLTGLGVAKSGEAFGDQHKVLDARFYRPPYEFDLTTPLNPATERKVNLAVRLNEAKKILKYRGSKPHAIALVRAPLVLVHGVNPHPMQWIKEEEENALGTKFHNDFGFRCIDFLVNHRGVDPQRTTEGETLGFGEISSMYQRVRDKIGSQDPTHGAATNRFRIGDYFRGFDGRLEAGKRIAVQKADVIAHSYGGLLSRWYIERSGDFASRRNVRKLVTLGTPHKGSPLANVVCEALKGELIANAGSSGILNFRPSMATLLSGLDIASHRRETLPLLIQQRVGGALPNALDPARTKARHAYQVFSVGSQRLAELNGVAGGQPFHDDVGYAAIIGQNQLLFGLLAPYTSFQAVWRVEVMDFSRPYWPWLGVFNHGPIATDAIVPEWSATLGVPGYNAFVPTDHVNMDAASDINDYVRRWLNNSVPRGAAHRAGFVRTPPISERNAHDGSKVVAGGASTGAGLRGTAIVKVELGPQEAVPPFEFPGHFGTKPNEVGLRPIRLTGMIRLGRIGAEKLRIRSIHGVDGDVHDMGSPLAVEFGVPANDQAGAAGGDYVTFSVSSGRIGRRFGKRVIGPTGESENGTDALIVYQMAEIPGGQSPPARATLPAYTLPAPTKGGPGNLVVTVVGTVEARGVGGGAAQTTEVRLYHDNLVLDTLLEILGPPPAGKVLVSHPADIFNGLLIPYDSSTTLSIAVGGVQGTSGNSGANPAKVYQYLLDHNVSSQTIAVP